MKFSHDGKFLATAGQDRMVYVWKVAAGRGASQPPQSPDKEGLGNGSGTGRQCAPKERVVHPSPARVLKRYDAETVNTGAIQDLLSSS